MKRGFTLIELMAVIIILGIISLIAIVSVDKVIKDNKENLYKTQIANIKDAAKTWGTKNISYLPDEKGEAISIPLLVLKRDGILVKNLTNPKNDKLFNNNMYIDISYENGEYNYNVIEESISDDNNALDLDYPAIILKTKYNFTSYPSMVNNPSYIVKRDNSIISWNLPALNSTTSKTSTLTFDDNNKTFVCIRKMQQ